jgi:Fic family protein
VNHGDGFIIEHRAQYYRGLRAVTERGEWEAWLMYMLEAVEAMAHGTAEKINAIRDLLAETLDTASAVRKSCSMSILQSFTASQPRL